MIWNWCYSILWSTMDEHYSLLSLVLMQTHSFSCFLLFVRQQKSTSIHTAAGDDRAKLVLIVSNFDESMHCALMTNMQRGMLNNAFEDQHSFYPKCSSFEWFFFYSCWCSFGGSEKFNFDISVNYNLISSVWRVWNFLKRERVRQNNERPTNKKEKKIEKYKLQTHEHPEHTEHKVHSSEFSFVRAFAAAVPAW